MGGLLGHPFAEHFGERELGNELVRGIRDHDGIVLRRLTSGHELTPEIEARPERLTVSRLQVREVETKFIPAQSLAKCPDVKKESRHGPFPLLPRVNRVAMLIQFAAPACPLGTTTMHFGTGLSCARPVAGTDRHRGPWVEEQ